MQGFDPSQLDADEISRLVKSSVTPRPIGWISTRGVSGVDNLAPFSCFTYLNHTPPVILFRCGRNGDGSLKDTARNALDTGEFVANVVTEAVAEKMNETGASLPAEESEFDYADVARADSKLVDPPRVRDAVINMECSLFDTLEIYDSVAIAGEVEYFHVSADVMTNGKVDMRKIDSVGRLGGPYYTRLSLMDIRRI